MELMETFCELYRQLRLRKTFDVDQDEVFFSQVQAQLSESEKLFIRIAKHDGTPVAGHVSSMLGDTCVYLLGASNQQALDLNASYLLQWHTIVEAKRRGLKWYDLGGIDPQGNPGVFRFKQRMGGEEVSFPGPFEAAPGGLARLWVRGGEQAYRWLRRGTA